jgi:hypothetical protein
VKDVKFILDSMTLYTYPQKLDTTLRWTTSPL